MSSHAVYRFITKIASWSETLINYLFIKMLHLVVKKLKTKKNSGKNIARKNSRLTELDMSQKFVQQNKYDLHNEYGRQFLPLESF